MDLYFITGNKSKFAEVQAVIPDIKQLDVDLPELQEIDSHKIITEKLRVAFIHKQGNFIVEDNSLIIKGMNGLPGPLIKWFLKSIGNDGLHKLTSVFGSEAEAKVIIGFAHDETNIMFFEGTIEGKIVAPRGEMGFGWDPVFLPNGYEKTFGEMNMEEKNAFSSRRIAVEKLKDYLNTLELNQTE